MIFRLALLVYLLITLACSVFFIFGDAILDPSFEYDEAARRWLSVWQWLAVAITLILGWFLHRFERESSED